MKHLVQVGTVDYTALLKLIRSSSTTGAPLTGLTYLDVDFAYTRVETDNDVTVTGVAPATLASLTAAHSDWGFIKVDDTEAPGLYRLDIADAVFAAGAWSADVTVRQAYATTVALQTDLEFQLVSFNPFDSVRMGLTALPNAAADAAGGLPISDAGGLDLDMISTTAYATKTNTTTLITTCDSIITVASATKTNTATIITTCDAIHTHAGSIETVAYITRTNTDTIITTANAIHTHAESIETVSYATRTLATAIDTLSKAGGDGDLAVIKTTCLATLTDTGTTLDGKIDAISTVAYATRTLATAIDTLTKAAGDGDLAVLKTTCLAILTDTGTTLDGKVDTISTVAYATRTNTATIITTSDAIHTHADLIEDVLANKMVVTEADGSTTLYADDDATPLLTCTLTSTLGRTTRTKLA